MVSVLVALPFLNPAKGPKFCYTFTIPSNWESLLRTSTPSKVYSIIILRHDLTQSLISPSRKHTTKKKTTNTNPLFFWPRGLRMKSLACPRGSSFAASPPLITMQKSTDEMLVHFLCLRVFALFFSSNGRHVVSDGVSKGPLCTRNRRRSAAAKKQEQTEGSWNHCCIVKDVLSGGCFRS